jgi:hypothetical protein
LAAGIAIAAAIVLMVAKSDMPKKILAGIALVSVAFLGVYAAFVDITEDTETGIADVSADIGIGPYVALVGAVIAVVGAVLALKDKTTAVTTTPSAPPPSSPTPPAGTPPSA